MLPFIEFGYMLVIDIMFILCLVLLMLPLGMWRQAAYAVMKRNFVAYFSSPTGYVFLCLFVLLTSFAAFWPHEFFTTNLANLDQLNKYLPYIMLVFIPAITMSIWAEEKRQGTDELLLTLPAKDFDIVIGKYFAAVLVFTVSLLFSQLSNYAVLIAMTGAQLDSGLMFATYLGYWWMGIAMLSIGMVASFLTHNLTVGFIFGAAFNAPLAFFSNSDVILSDTKWISRLFEWSLLQRFESFGRGLISLPSIFYFLGLVVIGIYLSMILIGRRHWLGGRDGTSMLSHFVLRALFLVAMMVSIVLIAQHSPLNRVRADISANEISSLSPTTIAMLEKLTSETTDEEGRELPPIKIDAYVSNHVPTEYVQTKQNLVNLLHEFDLLGGSRVELNLREGLEPFSAGAISAEKRFGIRPFKVTSESRGAIREENIIMGVAFTSGRERTVTPVIYSGMPVEYELMRSVNTVSQTKRKKIGIVATDARITGELRSVPVRNQQTGEFVRNQQTGEFEVQTIRIPPLKSVLELLKQYDVEIVNAATPIPVFLEDDEGRPTQRKYDAMLVVQPSKMTSVELENLIDAIQLGQPMAIFEDPLPNKMPDVPGTFYPRKNSRGGDTADIQRLWDVLDLNIDRVPIRNQQYAEHFGTQTSAKLAWKRGNPYPRDSSLNLSELVILNEEGLGSNTAGDFFDKTHPATVGISQLLFEFAGYVKQKRGSKLNFLPLVYSENMGESNEFEFSLLYNSQRLQQLEAGRAEDDKVLDLAAEIRGGEEYTDLPSKVSELKGNRKYTNVIYVADIDLISDFSLDIRNSPIRNNIRYRFQNLSFFLNVIDSLTGENKYQEIRNPAERHVTLKVVENTTEKALDNLYNQTQKLQIEHQDALRTANKEATEKFSKLESEIAALEGQRDDKEVIDLNRLRFLEQAKESTQRIELKKMVPKLEQLKSEYQENVRQIQLDAELEVQEIQRKFKLAAVVIPPIPPLLIGLIVFTRRRLKERQGIAKARRLK